ncbi:MAG: T9SS type A sorting domain-containing protein, partial [Saprospiraceae bacterium]
NGLTALGNPIESPVNPGVIERGNFNPPLTIIQTPMSLGQHLAQNSYVVFNIPLAIIPDTILDQLPIQPDSLRAKLNTEYAYDCTGSGTLKCPGRDFEVLQQTATTKLTTKIEAKLPFLGWIDVSGFIDLGEFGAERLSSTITFWSETQVGYVAQFQRNPDTGNFEISRYTTDGTLLDTKSSLDQKLDFVAYPNPATDIINFDLTAANHDKVSITIVDITGKILYDRITLNDYSVNISKLPSGTYYVKISTDKGISDIKKIVKI